MIGAGAVAYGKRERRFDVVRGGLTALAVGVVGFAACCVAVVDSGHVGFTVVFGRVNTDTALAEGVSIVNPFATVISQSIRTENYTMSRTRGEGDVQGDDSIEGLSKEGLKMPLDVTVVYRQIGKDAAWVYQTFGNNWRDVLVRAPSRTSVREANAMFEGVKAFAEERDAFATQISEKLTARVKSLIADRGGEDREGIKIVDVQLRQVGLPQTIIAAIERKLEAQQDDERMVYLQTKEEKEKARRLTEAQGIAGANAEIQKSITPEVLQFRAIEAMLTLAESPNTKVYIIGGGEGGMPLILNTGKDAN